MTRTPARVRENGAGARILLVDDHTIVREGIRRILEARPEGWQVVEASSGFEALQLLADRRFDAAVLDLSLPGMHGLDLIARIRRAWPALAVLVLSMHAEQEYALRAFKAGANGYLTKDGAAGELARALAKVLSGGTYVTPGIAEQVVLQMQRGGDGDGAPHRRLTDREMEVMQRLVDGERATDIAAALHLSPKTISTHKAHVMDKLGVDSMAALVRYALAHGLQRNAPAEPGSGPGEP